MSAVRKTAHADGRPDAPAAGQVAYLTIGPDGEGQRLDNYLLRLAKGVPKSHVYRIVRSGEVRVNKGRVGVDYRLAVGDIVRVPPLRTTDRKARSPAPADMPPVLFEDDHLIAIDKPSGLAAHGGSGVAHGLIERVRAARPYQPFLELVHRLDRETSGILLLAKTRRALVELHRQMRDGEIDKRYVALVKGDWVNDRQHVKLPLAKHVNRQGERRVSVDPEGSTAHTVFTLRRRYRSFSLLEAELRTGRTHQIRVHLAHLGFPIVGDDKYGDFELNKSLARADARPRLARMFLHATAMHFAHPVGGQPTSLHAPLPADCATFLKGLDAAPL
jgi:23S rRNA pseudouridine955/2504/2580 synthase